MKNDSETTDVDEAENGQNPLKKGDVVKDYTAYEDFDKAVVQSLEDDKATVLMIGGSEKGEVREVDRDSIKKHEPEVYVAILPQSWGVGRTRENAIMNATAHFRSSDHDEPVTLWTAKVHENHWEISPMGGVTSRFIRDEREEEVEPELLERMSDVKEDIDLMAGHALSKGSMENAESYLREVARR